MQPGSLYNHFESKEALWYAVLDHIEELYMMYFARLDEAWKTVTSFEETLESMFVELKMVVNIFTYYAFSLVITEQFRDKKAGELYNDVFIKFSVEYIKKRFDECIERGWVKPFDTKTVAVFFMNTVLVNITVRVQEDMGRGMPYNVEEMYTRLQQFILDVTESIPRE